ncbi:hypothetical protein Ancab_004640, partial [Ancistrocladus abbreviatus]
DEENVYRGTGDGDRLELSLIGNDATHDAMDEYVLEDLKVSHVMSKSYLKVGLTMSLKEAIKHICESQNNCALMIDNEDLLGGILTYGDIKSCLSKMDSEAANNSTL